jgi:hypothetical protein
MGSPVQERRTIRSHPPEKAARSVLLAREGKHGVKQALLIRMVLVSVVISTHHDVFVIEQAWRNGDVRRRARGGKLGLRLRSAPAGGRDVIHGYKFGTCGINCKQPAMQHPLSVAAASQTARPSPPTNHCRSLPLLHNP